MLYNQKSNLPVLKTGHSQIINNIELCYIEYMHVSLGVWGDWLLISRIPVIGWLVSVLGTLQRVLVVPVLAGSGDPPSNPFFVGIGKGSFLKALFQYAEFICCEGSLSDVQPGNKEKGYLAYLRLVGAAYFLKYRSSYRGTKSPVTLYHSCQSALLLDNMQNGWTKSGNMYGSKPRMKKFSAFTHSSTITVAEDSLDSLHVGTGRI